MRMENDPDEGLLDAADVDIEPDPDWTPDEVEQ